MSDGEPLEAGAPSCGARTAGSCRVLAVAAVGAPALLRDELAVDEREEPALGDLGLAERRAGARCSTTSSAARVEAKNTSCRPARDPERSADPAGEVEDVGLALVDPGGRHRADAAARASSRRVPCSSTSAKIASESTVISGSARVDVVAREELLVVDDDPVVDARHVAVADRMVVGDDRRVALRVVAHVDERLRRVAGGRRPSSSSAVAPVCCLCTSSAARAAVRVADGVGAALGDPGEQRLGGERPVMLESVPKLYPAMPHMLSFAFRTPLTPWTTPYSEDP